MADGAVSDAHVLVLSCETDGHGGVLSNHRQDNHVQGRQSSANPSTGANPRLLVTVSRRRRGLVLASGRRHPANARNLINPTGITTVDAQAAARIVAGPLNIGGARRAVHAAVVANVEGVATALAPFGNPVAVQHAGVGVLTNAGGAGAIGPLVGPHIGGVAPAGPAPAQVDHGGVAVIRAVIVAPPGPFDLEAGLSGPHSEEVRLDLSSDKSQSLGLSIIKTKTKVRLIYLALVGINVYPQRIYFLMKPY